MPLVEAKTKYFYKALDFAHGGLRLDPNRAEFHVMIGDAYVRLNNLQAPAFLILRPQSLALRISTRPMRAQFTHSAIFTAKRQAIQLGKDLRPLRMLLDKAKKEAQECIEALWHLKRPNSILERSLKGFDTYNYQK
jgi:hypothetical protein